MVFITHATLRAKPGQAATLAKHLQTIAAEVRANEPGCKHYYPSQNPEDENEFIVWEEYDDEDAVTAHRKGKAYVAMVGERETLIESLTLKRLSKL